MPAETGSGQDVSAAAVETTGVVLRSRPLAPERGVVDLGAPRFRRRGEGGETVVDPLFPGSDPWYDGRGHGYTIVDGPRFGSVLSLDEVCRAVCGGEWLGLAELYDGPESRARLAADAERAGQGGG